MLATSPASFESERPYLMSVAYRMLGSSSDAEDIVQEALLRAASARDIETPRAYLTTVVTRLCIDELRSARRRRETYVGPWLPEPLLTSTLDAPSERGVEHKESVSLAFLLLLDQLSPRERAVFVLREVFDLEFSDIARAVERSEAACRKLLSRARAHLEANRDAGPAPAQEQLAVAGAFLQALASGDLNEVIKLLTDDVATVSDHGGKASAAQNSVRGSERVARFFLGIFSKGQRAAAAYAAQLAYVNGAPAVMVSDAERKLVTAIVLRITAREQGAAISAIDVMRNPDKLRAVGAGARLP